LIGNRFKSCLVLRGFFVVRYSVAPYHDNIVPPLDPISITCLQLNDGPVQRISPFIGSISATPHLIIAFLVMQ